MSDEDRDCWSMADTRRQAAAVRIYTEREIEESIRQMKLDGATLEDCEAELQVLSDFVRALADGLRAAWPDLLEGTFFEQWTRHQTAAKTLEAMGGSVPDFPDIPRRKAP